MSVRLRTAVTAALLLLSFAGSAFSQQHRHALGLYGGGSVFGDFTPYGGIPIDFANGWIGGLRYDRWIDHGRFGVRLDTWYMERDMVRPHGDFNLYGGTVGFVARLFDPAPDRVIAPYALAGLGVVRFDAAFHPPYYYPEDPTHEPILTLGLGADFGRGGLGVQVEVAEQVILDSPFTNGPETASGPVHHGVVSVALQRRWGRVTGRPVVVAAPEPPVAVKSAPTPAPAVPERPAEPAAEQEPVQEETFVKAREPVQAPEPAHSASARTLYTVQVAASLYRVPAEQLAEQLRRAGLPVWVSQVQVEGQTFNRVRVGAADNRLTAVRLGERLQREYRVPVWVAPIEDPGAIMQDMIERTRKFVGH